MNKFLITIIFLLLPGIVYGQTTSCDALSAGSALGGTEAFCADQGAATVKVTPADIATYIYGDIDADDIDDAATTNKFVTATDITNLGNLSGTNSGDQTSIVGITGTTAEFNTALSDADFATGGGTASGTNTGDQTSIVGITGTAAQFDTAVTDDDFAYQSDITGFQSDVITTRGDVIIGDATGAASRLAVGTSGQVLTTDGTDVSWGDAAAGGGIGTFNGTTSETATGTNAQAQGICSASGADGICIGSGTSSGQGLNDILLGEDNTTGTDSNNILIGRSNDASSGRTNVGIGENITLNDNYQVGIGDNVLVQSRAGTAIGEHARSDRRGEVAFAIERNANPYSIYSFFGLGITTSNDTPTLLKLDLDGTAGILLIDTDQVMVFDILCTAGDFINNDQSATWHIQGAAENQAGTSALLGTVSGSGNPTRYSGTMNSTSISVTVNDTIDIVEIEVTGLSAVNIQWACSARTVETFQR